MNWATRPAVHPGDIIEADEPHHDAGNGHLTLLVTAIGWRERHTDGQIWLNLRGIRIHPDTPPDNRPRSGEHAEQPEQPEPPEPSERAEPPGRTARTTGHQLTHCHVRIRLDTLGHHPQPVPGADHLPCVPDWTCLNCRQEWPCPTAHTQLPVTYAGQRRHLSAYLATCYTRAVTDLPHIPSRDLHHRFLGWLRRNPRPGPHHGQPSPSTGHQHPDG